MKFIVDNQVSVCGRPGQAIFRLPTLGGPPSNYYDGLPRQSTYPSLSYNAELDGIGLTYTFDSLLPKDHGGDVRAVYTPFSHLNFGGKETPLSTVTNSKGTKASYDPVMSFMVEYRIKDLGNFSDHFNFIGQYVKASNTTFADSANVAVFPPKMLDIEY